MNKQNEARIDNGLDTSTSPTHIRIEIPNSVGDYPRVYIDGENLSNGINRAVQSLLLNYNTGTPTREPKQSINIQYIERDAGGKWLVKQYQESTRNLDDDEENTDKEHQPKIHEIAEQPLGIYGNKKIVEYYWNTNDDRMIELLSRPNTRLVILEDDEDA